MFGRGRASKVAGQTEGREASPAASGLSFQARCFHPRSVLSKCSGRPLFEQPRPQVVPESWAGPWICLSTSLPLSPVRLQLTALPHFPIFFVAVLVLFLSVDPHLLMPVLFLHPITGLKVPRHLSPSSTRL